MKTSSHIVFGTRFAVPRKHSVRLDTDLASRCLRAERRTFGLVAVALLCLFAASGPQATAPAAEPAAPAFGWPI